MPVSELFLTSGTPAHIAALAEAGLSPSVRIRDAQRLLARGWHVPSAVFVDWCLADMAGLELVRRLRDMPDSRLLHLTMVLEEDDPACRRRALAAGADDYVLGPLTPALLVQRVAGLTGKAAAAPPARLRLGELEVDPESYSAAFAGRALPLRVNEMNLLIHFARRPNRVFSRGELIGALGKASAIGDERTVDVWVSRLRRSLARHGVPHLPRTVRSLGYVMDASVG